MHAPEEEWLSGWDPTPGIVSVWADAQGRATVWRREPTGELLREEARFRPWILLDRLDDLRHLGRRLAAEGEPGLIHYRELKPPGELRFLVSAEDGVTLASAVLQGAGRRLGRRLGNLRELGQEAVLALPPEEQYLVATGRNYFRGLTFDQLRRMQFDLETTGLTPDDNRIFLIAVRHPRGETEVLEGDEADLIRRLMDRVREADPDVIENHNLHGFDLPFLNRRAGILGIPLVLGRTDKPGLRQRAARRGMAGSADSRRRFRFIAPGRELIDTLDAVLRYDFATRDLPEHGLKAVARKLGVAVELLPDERARIEAAGGAVVVRLRVRGASRARERLASIAHCARAFRRVRARRGSKLSVHSQARRGRAASPRYGGVPRGTPRGTRGARGEGR